MVSIIDLTDLKLTAYYDYNYERFDMKPHRHAAMELMYVSNGTIIVEAENTKHTLRRGQFILLDADIVHRLTVSSKSRVLNLELLASNPSEHRPFAGAPLLNPILSNGFTHYVIDDSSGIEDCINRILRELVGSETNESLVNIRVHELLLLIGKSYRSSQSGNPHVKKALAFIDANFTEELRVADIAAAVGIHPSYLQRQFRDQTDCTIIAYIRGLRIDKAKKLMAATQLPIIDIAAEVGYNNRQNFYKAFRSEVGIDPSRYLRNQHEITSTRYVQTPYEHEHDMTRNTDVDSA